MLYHRISSMLARPIPGFMMDEYDGQAGAVYGDYLLRIEYGEARAMRLPSNVLVSVSFSEKWVADCFQQFGAPVQGRPVLDLHLGGEGGAAAREPVRAQSVVGGGSQLSISSRRSGGRASAYARQFQARQREVGPGDSASQYGR